MKTGEIEDFRIFCAPAELHKAINMLRGLVAGISCDTEISDAEIKELSNWISLHANLENRHPFTELIPAVAQVVEQDLVTEEAREDILYLCNQFSDGGEYYDLITSAIQVLHGLVHGVLADGELSDAEIRKLQDWLYDNDNLRGVYPYDELDSLICAALADGKISHDEREMLKGFLGTLIEFKDSRNLAEADFAKMRERYSVQGICAVCQEIEFEGKNFCFTGQSERGTRAEIQRIIKERGGAMRNGVSKKTDYLIVGNGGNPCWAFACYGRKIEEAIKLRKQGAKIMIVNEVDFWDAIEN